MPNKERRAAADDVRDDRLSHTVIGCAINVHRQLGVGLLESAYEECLAYELVKEGLDVARQAIFPVVYRGVRINRGFKADFIINHELLLELKTVSQLLPVHDAQVLTYLRFSGIERGLLMNFHAETLAKGIKRFVLSRLSP